MIQEIINNLSCRMKLKAEVSEEVDDEILISYAIYQVDGMYICCKAERYITFDDCSNDKFEIKICSTGNEMLEFFGNDRLTKQLTKRLFTL
jgi:transcription initiation factor IIE alpha subunit